MPSALVTGAGGFVGRQLCRVLVERNWRVVRGHRRNGPSPAVPDPTGEYLPLLAEPQRWQRALQSIDCVVHLAACVHQMGRDAESDASFAEINVAGSRFVAEQSVYAGVKRFVFLSSSKVNGEGCGSRTYRADDQSDPRDAYARSKLAAERIVREICASSGMELVIVRPPLVHGPGVRANLERLLKLTDRAWPLPFSSIANRRSLVGVENLCDFIEICMTHPKAAGGIWFVTDGEDMSTPELIRRLARFMERRPRLFACPPLVLKAVAQVIGRRAEMNRLCDSFALDTGPARDVLEWRPITSVDEGLRRMVADYLARPSE